MKVSVPPFEELGGGDAVAVHRGAVPFDVVDPSPPWDVPLRADAEAALVDSCLLYTSDAADE